MQGEGPGEPYQAPDRAAYSLGGFYEAVKNCCSLRSKNTLNLLAYCIQVPARKCVLYCVPRCRNSRNDLVKDFKALVTENTPNRFPHFVKIVPQKLHNGYYRRNYPNNGQYLPGNPAERSQKVFYQARVGRAESIYEGFKDLIAMLPKDAMTKLLVRQAIDALNAVSATLERLKTEMLNLASQLPEFPVVMAMRGVGKPYLVYMTAGANKFLRIYYGRVKEYLASSEQASATDQNQLI